jgi:hypothetical protein
VFESMSERVKKQQSQGVHVHLGVRTVQQTPRPESTCSMWCPDRNAVAATRGRVYVAVRTVVPYRPDERQGTHELL